MLRNNNWAFACLFFLACTSADKPTATISDVEQGIRTFIDRQTAAGDGHFRIVDDTLDMRLRLVRVHTEYLSVLGPNAFFACVDLADEAGDVYDVDFFLSGEPGSMDVTKMTLHKLNGKPFYTWEQQSDQTWSQVPLSTAPPALLGVIEGEDRFTFRYTINLPGEGGRLWFPQASSDPWQDVVISSIDSPMPLETLQDSINGNLAFHGDLPPASGERTLTVIYQVVRREKSPYPGEARPQDLAGTPKLPVGGRFTAIVDSITVPSDPALMNARRLYDYVIDNVRYAKQGTYGTGDALYACDAKSGNCTEFHSLFISLARTTGIPARFAIGASIPSSRNEGGMEGYHCWAEFHADGKWWPVDISEADKYTTLATYYFGHHPANRVELSRGRDLHFSPAPPNVAIPFFAYPVFESQGEAKPLGARFTFERNA